jgi:hypothetical protein
MTRKLPLALVSILVMVGVVCANAGPPPLPKGHKVAEPPVRFEGIDKHPDYIFHLYYYGYFVEAALIELKDEKAIKLNFKSNDRTPALSYMGIKAMERKEFDKRKKADPKLKWFDDFKAEGVLAAKIEPPKTTMPIEAKEIPVTTYRVTLKDGKLSAEKVEAKKDGAAGQAGLLPPWTFGILMSLSMTWFGIWLARRGSGAH